VRFPGFIGPSYQLQSLAVDCQRTVNLYPEMNEAGMGKDGEVASLVATPGLRTLLTLAAGATRGGHVCASNGALFVAAGNKLYGITSAWASVELGTLSTSEGPISFADNGAQVVLVDGTYAYVWTIGTNTFAQVTDPDFVGADHVTFQDGYFIFNETGTGRIQITDLYNTNFDALDFATAEGSPDNLTAVVSDGQNLYLPGDRTTEVFYNSGDASFPFERHQGALINVGIAAGFTLQLLQGGVYWLGQDASGRGVVYRAQGFQPQRISTHAIETVIAGLGDLSEARAWVYQQSGHAFYVLNLPGASTTWVFDAATNLWHERASLTYGEFGRHRADWHAYAYDTHVVGDFETGALYALESATLDEGTLPLLRERTAPYVSKENKRIFHHSFQLDMETGVGLDGTGQGTDPVAVLQWSDDGGQTWSSEREASVGRIGEHKVRVIWRRLGSARARVYRVRISDPVRVTIIGANLEIEEGAS
jgi:hypothetical protein